MHERLLLSQEVGQPLINKEKFPEGSSLGISIKKIYDFWLPNHPPRWLISEGHLLTTRR